MKRISPYIIFVLCGILASCHSEKFDLKQWKEWEETEATACLRWDMRKDLVREHELVGMTIGEIKELLGDPESESETEFRYFLGMARHGIDTGSLVFMIENGQVISYRFWHG